jgi:flagellar hook-associated protein 2
MASSVSSTSSYAPLFQAGGLASGLDTGSIVDALIQAESGPLNALKQKQSDYKVQISTLGSIASQLKDLQAAAKKLATSGAVSILPKTTYDDFSVSGSAKAEGNFAIKVTQVAKEARLRSKSFTSAQDASLITDGNLQFTIDGKDTVKIDTTGKTLADIAQSINANISGLTASVVSTDNGFYLNVARSTTGYATTADAALTVKTGLNLVLDPLQAAQNAQLTVDTLPVSRTTNTITNVIPGVTLQLTGASGVSNNVSFVSDASGTETALGTFVTAYNALAATLSSQLAPDPSQSYGASLIDFSSAQRIQNRMQTMLSTLVVSSGGVRTLADLGMEIQRDGTLSLDSATVEKAVAANPGAVNAIFSTAKTGIAAVLDTLVSTQTDSWDGALVLQQKSLQSSIQDMTDQQTSMQEYLDSERQRLTLQFANMETLLSGYQKATSYLTQVSNLKTNG